MTIILSAILALLILAIGFAVGYFSREIKEKFAELQKRLDEPPVEVGPTNPYHDIDENKVYNNDKSVGAVLPKTPQLLEFEEQEKLKKMNQASL
jgi:methyl coenzyme M reductase subunit C-like uncharacterized protein (methanogenesis marker protein 7)